MEELLRQMAEAESAASTRPSATSSSVASAPSDAPSVVRALQRALLVQQQRRSAATSGSTTSSSSQRPAARGLLWHTQLQTVQPSDMAGTAHACLASASLGSAGGGDLQPRPIVLHVLVSNHMSSHMPMSSVPTPPDQVQLLVTLSSVSNSNSSGGGSSSSSLLTVSTAFPSSRWSSGSTMQVPLTLDACLMAERVLVVRVALRVALDQQGEELDLLLNEWTLDLWDTASLPPAPPAAAPSSSNGKRKREEDQKSPRDQHSRTQRLNTTHQQQVLMHRDQESRVVQMHAPAVFGSLYSTPAWYACHLPSSIPKQPSAPTAGNTFQITCAIPLLLDWKPMGYGASIEHFTRLLLQSLMPAHASSFSPAALRALIPFPPTTAPSSAASSSPAAGPAAAPSSHAAAPSSSATPTRAHFLTMLHGRPIEWSIEWSNKPSAGSPPPTTICAIRVRAAAHEPNLVAKLRACVLKRLELMLFGSSTTVIAATAAGPTAATTSPIGHASTALTAAAHHTPPVSLRHFTVLSASASDAERDAHVWMSSYLNAGRSSAVVVPPPSTGAAPVARNGPGLGGSAVASIFAASSSAQMEHFRALAEQLVDTQAQLASVTCAMATAQDSAALERLAEQRGLETNLANDSLLKHSSPHVILC